MSETKTQPTTVVKVTGIHHSGIPCNDLDRAIDFYQRVLGFELEGTTREPSTAGHFLGVRTPPGLRGAGPEAEGELREFEARHQEARGRIAPTRFARMKCGRDAVVLFERPDPVEHDTHLENGIFHQSFHISRDDMERLIAVKRQGDSRLQFHNGPVLRWPHGRAMYMWDTEGNYLELESEETEEQLRNWMSEQS
jgi:catechol 2,3-dioxygenase-like lactoylglutathione lyase family enzyme